MGLDKEGSSCNSFPCPIDESYSSIDNSLKALDVNVRDVNVQCVVIVHFG